MSSSLRRWGRTMKPFGAATIAGRNIKRPCGRNTKFERFAAQPGCAVRNTRLECDHHSLVCTHDVHSLCKLRHAQRAATDAVSRMRENTVVARSLSLRALISFTLLILFHTVTMSQHPDATVPIEWLTHAEKTDYRETPRYAETIEYSKRLDRASPLIKFQSFGKSGEGRELPLLIATEDGTFTPEAARHAGKAVILIQACIHAGEPDGKDAGLALLRDIAITKTRPGLLNNLVVLFIPIYNTDGHERVSPYNRINQDGPAEMGWRTTSTYQNLNRDY